MTRKTALIAVLCLITIITLSVHLIPLNTRNQATGSTVPFLSRNGDPPLPQNQSEWIDVTLDTEYFYNDTATISWYGRPSSGLFSPYNPLYNWTTEGTIVGGIWPGNPGNATIDVTPKTNYSEPVVKEFLNYTMENYVRFVSWPSLDIFNFTEYVNGTQWVFNDAIANPVEYFNTTFFHVSNATKYLMNGFNATGIAPAVTFYRIYMEWNQTDSILSFSYKIPNATSLRDNVYVFCLGRYMGRSIPLTLAGVGTFRVFGPYNRMIINGTPTEAYETVTFPHFPISFETFNFQDEIYQEWEYKIWYRQPQSELSISREVSRTTLARGELLTVKVTVINTGDVSFSNLLVSDLGSIYAGILQLMSGFASTSAPFLASGENITIEYTAMAVQTGTFIMPAAEAGGIDLFQNQVIITTNTETITIGSGVLPSETILIGIAVGVIIFIVIILLLYRYRHRFF